MKTVVWVTICVACLILGYVLGRIDGRIEQEDEE